MANQILTNMLEEIRTREGLGMTFTLFMKTRFPNETDYSYIKEWANRFKSGNVEVYMDSTSLKIYTDLINR